MIYPMNWWYTEKGTVCMQKCFLFLSQSMSEKGDTSDTKKNLSDL